MNTWQQTRLRENVKLHGDDILLLKQARHQTEQEQLAEFERFHRLEAHKTMSMLLDGLIILGIVLCACIVAWW